MPLAALRPDDWDFPLLLHVLGAMLLVGTLVVVVIALVADWRGNRDPAASSALRRLALWTLLVGSLPSYVLMRIGAEWIASEENLDEAEADWVDIGYVIADGGLVVLIVTTALTGLAVRRGAASGSLERVSAVLVAVLLAAYVVAIWAMTTKPV